MTDQMTIIIQTASCLHAGLGPFSFDSADVAVAFLRALANPQAAAEGFYQVLRDMMPADLVEAGVQAAKQVIAGCTGTGL